MQNMRHKNFKTMGVMLGIAASAFSVGQPTIPSRHLRPPKSQAERLDGKMQLRRTRREINESGRIRNRRERIARCAMTSGQRDINRMTNWQNHQWMKTGAKPNEIDRFLGLKHPNKKRRLAKAYGAAGTTASRIAHAHN